MTRRDAEVSIMSETGTSGDRPTIFCPAVAISDGSVLDALVTAFETKSRAAGIGDAELEIRDTELEIGDAEPEIGNADFEIGDAEPEIGGAEFENGDADLGIADTVVGSVSGSVLNRDSLGSGEALLTGAFAILTG